jgi:hypothetical protein
MTITITITIYYYYYCEGPAPPGDTSARCTSACLRGLLLAPLMCMVGRWGLFAGKGSVVMWEAEFDHYHYHYPL